MPAPAPAIAAPATLCVLLLLLLPSGVPNASAAARDVPIEVGTRADGTMYVDPSNITIDLGDDVTLRVKNVDTIFHDIALLDYDGSDVEIEVPRGATEVHTFKATVAGDFRMICEVSGHKQKGMFGFLHVVDPAAKKGLPGLQVPVVALATVLVALLLAARRRA